MFEAAKCEPEHISHSEKLQAEAQPDARVAVVSVMRRKIVR